MAAAHAPIDATTKNPQWELCTNCILFSTILIRFQRPELRVSVTVTTILNVNCRLHFHFSLPAV